MNDIQGLPLETTPPKEEGCYWYYSKNASEHLPAVMTVRKEGRKLYADGGEFLFGVSKKPQRGEYWARIPDPMLNGKRIVPGSG